MSSHGADIDKLKRIYKINKEIIDFSSNINTRMPECVSRVIASSIDEINRYPDIEYISLRKVISNSINKRYKTSFSYRNICVGNGATELIFLISKINKFKKIGVVCPTFSEYQRAVESLGKDLFKYHMIVGKNTLEINQDDDYDDLDLIFICNPNNPDGRLRNLERVVEKCKSSGVVLVVDETFIEFCEEELCRSAIRYGYDNIVVLRAATKFYGIPGIRLGYAISKNESIIENMWSIKEPWSVNTFAEKLGLEIFEDDKFYSDSKSFFRDERISFINNLKQIQGIDVFETDSAFVLIRINSVKDNFKSGNLKEKMMLDFGIVIRDASDFDGLDDRYFRVAIKTKSDNEYFVDSLKKILGEVF